jgi:hypothetical protein
MRVSLWHICIFANFQINTDVKEDRFFEKSADDE